MPLRTYQVNTERVEATCWNGTATTVLALSGTQAGTPILGMVLTGSVSGATLTITYLEATLVVGTLAGNFQNGEDARNGANGYDSITRVTIALFYLTANNNATSPALFRNIWGYHLTGRNNTVNPLLLPAVAVKTIGTDRRVMVAEVTQLLASQLAVASADLTLTNAEQDIVGATLTLVTPGQYEITGVFDFNVVGDGDMGETMLGRLSVGAVIQSAEAHLRGIKLSYSYVLGAGESVTITLDNNNRATVAQQWLVTTTTVNTIVKLRALKTAGTGTSACLQTHTTIKAAGKSLPAATGLTVAATVYGD